MDFKHQEIYQIERGNEISLYQYRGYNDSQMAYAFYDLKYERSFFYLPFEDVTFGNVKIIHKPDLKQFYI